MVQTPNLLVMTFGSADLSDVAGHPNKMLLRGVLVRLDEPSTKPPGGAEGHCILVPTRVAEKRLTSLINMGLNYSPSLEEHAQRRKVGTITRAWIEGKDVRIEAVIWKHDFPEAEQDLKQAGLGMSMEIGNVQVEDNRADIWRLTDFYFLGATVLMKRSAAYYRTSAIAAQRSDMKTTKKTGTAASQQELIDQVTAAAVAATSKRVRRVETGLNQITGVLATMSAQLETLTLAAAGAGKGRVIDTAADDSEDDDGDDAAINACDKGMKAKDAVAAEEEEEMDAADDEEEEDDEDELEATTDLGSLTKEGGCEDEDNDAGKFNKNRKNKGRQTTVEDKIGKTVASARYDALHAAYQEQGKVLKKLAAQVESLVSTAKKQKKQIAAAAQDTSRRSERVVSINRIEASIIDKAGIDVNEMKAEGRAFSSADVDAMIASGNPNMSIVDRMAMKNRLLQSGLMKPESVRRGA